MCAARVRRARAATTTVTTLIASELEITVAPAHGWRTGDCELISALLVAAGVAAGHVPRGRRL